MKLKGDIAYLRHALNEVTGPVTKWCEEFKQFVLKTKCMSLCASQIGVRDRIVCVKNKSRKNAVVMVNPKVVFASKHKQKKRLETCMAGHGTLKAEVARPSIIIAKYNTPDLAHRRTRMFVGRQAAAACHVIDMCDGKLIK